MKFKVIEIKKLKKNLKEKKICKNEEIMLENLTEMEIIDITEIIINARYPVILS